MDPDDELSMHPGPRDSSLLHLQSTHRTEVVWKASGGDVQRSRHRNPNQERFPKLHERMLPILTDLRFDGVARLPGIVLDWGLMTVLVERWRPETHMFHLLVRECSITLQDVSVLLGLRIDGEPVTSSTEFEWDKVIEEVFVKTIGKGRTRGTLKLSWLTINFKELPDDVSDLELTLYTKSYLLQLFAGVLFTDHSGIQIHLMYLPLIRDLDRCRGMSWGSVVLAYLFRELCKGCRMGVEENAGCLLLLQLCAWTRLPTLALVPYGPSLDSASIWGDRLGPYGLRWCHHLRFSDSSSRGMATHRLTLDGLGPSHFIWQPYTPEILETLSSSCVDGDAIWCYKGPIICFHIVAPHVPNRCLRQFGFIQNQPEVEDYSKELHKIKLQGKQDSNRGFIHRDHLLVWQRRADHIIGGDIGVGAADGYNQWYCSMTRLFHTRLGGSHLYEIQLLEHISLVSKGVIEGDMNYIDHIATHGRDLYKTNSTMEFFRISHLNLGARKKRKLHRRQRKLGTKEVVEV